MKLLIKILGLGVMVLCLCIGLIGVIANIDNIVPSPKPPGLFGPIKLAVSMATVTPKIMKPASVEVGTKAKDIATTAPLVTVTMTTQEISAPPTQTSPPPYRDSVSAIAKALTEATDNFETLAKIAFGGKLSDDQMLEMGSTIRRVSQQSDAIRALNAPKADTRNHAKLLVIADELDKFADLARDWIGSEDGKKLLLARGQLHTALEHLQTAAK